MILRQRSPSRNWSSDALALLCNVLCYTICFFVSYFHAFVAVATPSAATRTQHIHAFHPAEIYPAFFKGLVRTGAQPGCRGAPLPPHAMMQEDPRIPASAIADCRSYFATTLQGCFLSWSPSPLAEGGVVIPMVAVVVGPTNHL